MGTNYYVVKNECDNCDRFDRVLHIGRAAAGWTFMFRGYRNQYDELSEQKHDIISYSDWLNTLKDKVIRNEYGEKVSFTQFKELVKDKQDAERNFVDDDPLMNNTWKDDDNYAFCSNEFS